MYRQKQKFNLTKLLTWYKVISVGEVDLAIRSKMTTSTTSLTRDHLGHIPVSLTFPVPVIL